MAGFFGSWFSGWRSRDIAVVEAAGPRDAARLAQLHGASFHRGWGEGEFELMLTAFAAHRLPILNATRSCIGCDKGAT